MNIVALHISVKQNYLYHIWKSCLYCGCRQVSAAFCLPSALIELNWTAVSRRRASACYIQNVLHRRLQLSRPMTLVLLWMLRNVRGCILDCLLNVMHLSMLRLHFCWRG